MVLTAEDLTVHRFPSGDAPAGADPHAVGRTLAAPVREGEPVTDVRLVSPSLLAGYPGRVAVPVRIADADAVGLLQTGDRVDLLAADPRGGRASYVAVDVPVVAVPSVVRWGRSRWHDRSADRRGRPVLGRPGPRGCGGDRPRQCGDFPLACWALADPSGRPRGDQEL